jgi:hypothetical protein
MHSPVLLSVASEGLAKHLVRCFRVYNFDYCTSVAAHARLFNELQQQAAFR